MTTLVLAERFWTKVDRSGGPDACWPWTGATNGGGYGQIGAGGRRGAILMAHRVAWELAHGPIPAGMCVLHRCDNPPCVNDSHLFLGTQAENLADMRAKGRGHHETARGERNGNAKLTADRVREIRRRLSAGQRGRVVAARFGIPEVTVSAIKHRRLWGWMTDG